MSFLQGVRLGYSPSVERNLSPGLDKRLRYHLEIFHEIVCLASASADKFKICFVACPLRLVTNVTIKALTCFLLLWQPDGMTMAFIPGWQQLEHRVKELERKGVERKRAEVRHG